MLRILLAIYAAASAVTFAAYWWDKRAAVRGRRRLRESLLHGLELIGGWPGALAAQRLLRHKSRKIRYQVIFIAIVMLHAALWTWLLVSSAR